MNVTANTKFLQSVRRLAVSALTSAAHNRPQLIRDHLGQLQPFLYAQAKIDPKLIHEVVMGPFKVKVDEGLNIRKVGLPIYVFKAFWRVF